MFCEKRRMMQMKDILTAEQFYEQRELSSREREAIKARILDAICDDNLIGKDGSINLPMGTITEATQMWLDKNGWVFYSGKLLSKQQVAAAQRQQQVAAAQRQQQVAAAQRQRQAEEAQTQQETVAVQKKQQEATVERQQQSSSQQDVFCGLKFEE